MSKERVQGSNAILRSLLVAGEYRGEKCQRWSRVATCGGAGIEEMRAKRRAALHAGVDDREWKQARREPGMLLSL